METKTPKHYDFLNQLIKPGMVVVNGGRDDTRGKIRVMIVRKLMEKSIVGDIVTGDWDEHYLTGRYSNPTLKTGRFTKPEHCVITKMTEEDLMQRLQAMNEENKKNEPEESQDIDFENGLPKFLHDASFTVNYIATWPEANHER